jgi:hypothetical protein
MRTAGKDNSDATNQNDTDFGTLVEYGAKHCKAILNWLPVNPTVDNPTVDDPTVDNPTGQSDSVDNPTEITVWGKKEGIR